MPSQTQASLKSAPSRRPRVLSVISVYPPHFVGGYEIGCKDVMDSLRKRGWETHVLTSRYKTGPIDCAEEDRRGNVYRTLPFLGTFMGKPLSADHRRILGAESIRVFSRAVRRIKPDIVYFWAVESLDPRLMRVRLPARTAKVTYASDEALPRWLAGLGVTAPTVYSRKAMAWTRIEPLLWQLTAGGAVTIEDAKATDPELFQEVHTASSFLRDKCREQLAPSMPVHVLHWGVDTGKFSPADKADDETKPIRILYVGQILPHKGVHTLVAAAKLLSERFGRGSFTLDMIGGSIWPEFQRQLEDQIAASGLGDVVRLRGKMERSSLPEVYRSHDVLAFPSSWDEPFSIVLLEAMSSGLAVAATRTGGTPEQIVDGVNGLLVPRDDEKAMADALASLITDPDLRRRIGQEARKTVVGKYQLNGMVDQVEERLHALVARDADFGNTADRKHEATHLSYRVGGRDVRSNLSKDAVGVI